MAINVDQSEDIIQKLENNIEVAGSNTEKAITEMD